ncbi:MAG TPA: RIP metalloprotease RseP [Dongiaceae bacterium]|jgi:regulator of sigma E protease|nr:RIP metalloprotease RseP [Dongiaceae bacterium]
MQTLAAIPQYGFWFLALLTVLVFVHEYGHYIVARWCGVRVEVFSIGFGPELFGRTDSHGTRWKVSAVPLGGYVKMFGQGANLLEGEAGKAMTEADRKVAFDFKSVWRRMAIVAAGPIANYLFAAVIFATIFAVHGKDVAAPIIGEVSPGSAASAAGLQSGDRIVSLNGTAIGDFDEIREFVQLNLDQEIAIAFSRDGIVQTVHARPIVSVQKDPLGNEVRLGRLGIAAAGKADRIELGPLDAAKEGVKRVFEVSALMLKGVWQMITGVRPANELGGVLRIGYLSGEIAQIGLWSLIHFAAMLSVNLGLVNLFPIPLLDGGHLTYYGIEAARGKPLGERTQEWGFRIGIAFVLGLMLFATWNDLVFLDVIGKLRALFT